MVQSWRGARRRLGWPSSRSASQSPIAGKSPGFTSSRQRARRARRARTRRAARPRPRAARRARGAPSGYSCELACDPDDEACRFGCVTAAGTSAGESIASFDGCVASSCAPSCAGTCGNLAPVTPAANAAPCASCVAAACCAQASACAANNDCRAAGECVRSYNTPDAIGACTSRNTRTGARRTRRRRLSCGGSCPDDCAYGTDWTCLARSSAWRRHQRRSPGRSRSSTAPSSRGASPGSTSARAPSPTAIARRSRRSRRRRSSPTRTAR